MKRRTLLIAILVALANGDETAKKYNASDTDGTPAVRYALQNALLLNYDQNAVPLRLVNGTTRGVNVTIYMWPYDILYVNEAQGAIKISGWIDMRWTDPVLVWNPVEHENISSLFIRRNKLWLPEINIFYSKDENPITQKCTDCPVRVDEFGQVLRGYYFAYSFPCVMDVKHFPFDSHVCNLELANWHLDLTMMDLWPENNTVDLSIFLPNEEWDVVSMSVSRKVEEFNYGHFPILHYKVLIKRKPFYYIINLVVPTLILTFTALIGYHMPSAGNGMHQEKVKMGLTTILSIYILQLGVSDKLPRTSDVIPLISVFYSCMVGLLSMAIVSTSLIILLEKQGIYDRPVPDWARLVFITAALRAKRGSGRTLPHASPSPAFFHCHSPKCRLLDCGCVLKRQYGGGRQYQRHGSASTQSSFVGGTGNYELLIGSSSNGGGAGGGVHSPMDTPPALIRRRINGLTMGSPASVAAGAAADGQLNNSLLDTMAQLRRAINALNMELAAKTDGAQRKAEWFYLADAVENVSFVFFMFGLLTSLLLFFYHDRWY